MYGVAKLRIGHKSTMRKQLVVIGFFSALTGVMTLTLTSNDTTPERGKSLQLSCLTDKDFKVPNSIRWINPHNVSLTTCAPILPGCNLPPVEYNSSYRFEIDIKGAYVSINNLSREQDNGKWTCTYKDRIEDLTDTTVNTEIIVYTSPGYVHLVQPIIQDKDLGVESIILTCQNERCCYPAPTIAWYYTTSTGQSTLYQGSSGILSNSTYTCTQSEARYTSTLQLNRGTTFMNNEPVTTKFKCGIQHPTLKGDTRYSQNSKNVTFAVKLTSLTLKNSSGINLPNTVYLIDGTTVTLTCLSSTSHPTATVNWYIENNRITSGINNVAKISNNGLQYVESTLTLTPSNTDHHNKRIYCQAYNINENDVIKTDSLMYVKVKVEGIKLHDGSSAVVSSNLPVVDGTPTSLTCETTPSRPAAIIIWYKGDILLNNNVITTNWTRDGLDIIRSSLNLTPSNNDHGQYIYCQAYNINPVDKVTSNRATLQVTVYVKSITMSSSGSPLGSPLIFLEGQEKRIQCVTSPSRPQPQVRWWLGKEQVLEKITESESSSGNLNVTTSVISLTLNRSHTHKVLYCETTVAGQLTWISSTKSDVTVQYAPDVRVNIPGSTVVGFTVVLMCTAQGDPPQYTFHPWIHRVGQTEIRRLNGEKTDIISNLTLSNISIQDMGLYICTVDNTITGLDSQLYQTGDTSLYVQGRPVIKDIKTPFTGVPLKPISIQIPFYSHTSIQKLTFIKQIGSQEIQNTSVISSYIQPSNISMMFYNKNVTIPGYVAVLQFRNLTETDFSSYTLTLANGQGSETMQFEFIASVSPSMPKNFVFIHIDDGFMVFGLEKGFNGGHQQTFVVEYRPSGMSGAAWSTVYRINEDDMPNPSSNGTYYIKIPKIQDGRYDFRVYAENVEGKSSAVEGVSAEIKTESPPGPSGLLIGAVAGGVVGGISIAIVIIVVIFVIKRRKLNPKMKEYEREEESSDQKHQDSELKLNPVYDSSNPEPLVPVYAAVTKPKKPIAQNEDSNVYAQVDKSKGNKSKMAPKVKPVKASKAPKEKPVKSSKAAQKGKPVKSSRGDIYENSPLPLKNPEEFVYENPGLVATDPNESVYENPGPSASKGHLADKDGLQYAVLKLGPPTTKGGKPVIHGLENRTEYAEIAFGKRGEPLPDSDEEKKDGAK